MDVDMELAVGVDAVEARFAWGLAMLDILCVAGNETDLLDGETFALGLCGVTSFLRDVRRDLRAEVDRGFRRARAGAAQGRRRRA